MIVDINNIPKLTNCIYKITSPNGKVYIGSTKALEVRFKDYRKISCKMQTKLYNSLRKYGVHNHTYEVLMWDIELEVLLECEHFIGVEFDVCGRGGLNCKIPKHSDTYVCVANETRSRMGAKKGYIPWNKGKVTGQVSAHRKKIINTETGEIYNSISEAAKSNGLKTNTLSMRLNKYMLTGANHKKRYNLEFYDC